MISSERIARSRKARWIGGALAVVAAGFLLLWTGIIPIRASSGHSPPVAWLLHYAMRQSVETWSLPATPPKDLDDPARVLQGAGHYATGCAPCHGAPGDPPSEIVKAMTPHPPRLESRMDEWDEEELFYIVRHGVKYTGMPAWPVDHRDDEVWSQVAFLQRLPELSGEQYRRLAYGDVDAFDTDISALEEPMVAVKANCARCHGRHGEGREGAFPRLDRQKPAYVAESLKSYARGRRPSGVMGPLAQDLEPEQIEELARHFSGHAAALDAVRGADDQVTRGERIATEGVPERRVPACRHCHGPDPVADHPVFPRLAGQPAAYLAGQIELFKQRHRGGTPYAPIMTLVAQKLEQEEINAVAAYYAAAVE